MANKMLQKIKPLFDIYMHTHDASNEIYAIYWLLSSLTNEMFQRYFDGMSSN